MTSFRIERIEKLIKELEYEVVRGLEQNEIPDGHLGYRSMLPPFGLDYPHLFRVEVRPGSEVDCMYLGGRQRNAELIGGKDYKSIQKPQD